uniref:uncharacterized protein LOC128929853 n=1 Tax=Callithrix jacchus TaxID=9483 RepID=UPI0023DD1A8C|nr:uncharacterized protein LOC128929853 [Callithrix jacchus]
MLAQDPPTCQLKDELTELGLPGSKCNTAEIQTACIRGLRTPEEINDFWFTSGDKNGSRACNLLIHGQTRYPLRHWYLTRNLLAVGLQRVENTLGNHFKGQCRLVKYDKRRQWSRRVSAPPAPDTRVHCLSQLSQAREPGRAVFLRTRRPHRPALGRCAPRITHAQCNLRLPGLALRFFCVVLQETQAQLRVPSIAQLVERRTVATSSAEDILRSLVRFRLEGDERRFLQLPMTYGPFFGFLQ